MGSISGGMWVGVLIMMVGVSRSLGVEDILLGPSSSTDLLLLYIGVRSAWPNKWYILRLLKVRDPFNKLKMVSIAFVAKRMVSPNIYGKFLACFSGYVVFMKIALNIASMVSMATVQS